MKNNIEFFNFYDSRYEIVKSIRTTVFTNEQGAQAENEFDEYDKFSLFALLYQDETPVATARLAETEKGFKIGRIAVLKTSRGRGYGATIVNFVTEKAFNVGADVVYVDAQNHAVPFYQKLGFNIIGQELVDRGLPHIPMSISRGEFYGE